MAIFMPTKKDYSMAKDSKFLSSAFVPAFIKNLFNQKKARPAKIIITEDTLKRVLGDVHYTEAAIYDNEHNKLLTQTYNGQKVDWRPQDSKNAATFKKVIDKELKKYKVTLVCTVLKQVSWADNPGVFNWTQPGKQISMNANGPYTVCNFIIRNNTTGNLVVLSPDAWLGVSDLVFPAYAAEEGLRNVAHYGAQCAKFQNIIIERYNRSKVSGK